MSSELRNTGEKSNLQKFAKMRHSGKESLLEVCADDGFGDRTPACREYTHPRAESDSKIYVGVPGRTVIEPVVQVHIFQFLDTHGVEVQIPSTTKPKRTSWV